MAEREDRYALVLGVGLLIRLARGRSVVPIDAPRSLLTTELLWKAGAVYASLEQLRETVAAHPDEDMRALFEYHSNRVAEVLASQPDVPATETTMAGFLNGFRTAATVLADDPRLAIDTMDAQLGGIYLYAVETTKPRTETADEPSPDPRRFFARLDETLLAEPVYLALTDKERRTAQETVRRSFAETPDVPVTAASLAGFVLGLLYATPFVAQRAIPAIVALMDAARALVPPEP
jgi:hypothetical protein